MPLAGSDKTKKSSPFSSHVLYNANIAQLEEHPLEAWRVLGSIPSVGTKEPKKFGYLLSKERSQVRILLVVERLL